MTHSVLVVVLIVVGVSYGRQWTNVDELEDYLTNNYDVPLGSEVGTRTLETLVFFYEIPWDSHSNHLPTMWPGGVVYYHIENNASNKQRGLIVEAMRVIEDVSCVKFRPSKRQDKLTIRVERNANCYSNVGYIPWGGELHLGNACFQQSTIIHELLHALGMDHQHSASNRDNYVTIHLENIPKELQDNYIKNKMDLPAEREFGYDYKSIMHYPSFASHPSVGRFLGMTAKDPNVKLGHQTRMSHKDIMKLNRMYNCIQKH